MELLHWNEAGLIPAIVQNSQTRDVLMVAWMSAESLQMTLDTGQTHFWSRSRAEIWHKGATSGNTQQVESIRVDERGEALLLEVQPAGPACHTGETTCFFRMLDD